MDVLLRSLWRPIPFHQPASGVCDQPTLDACTIDEEEIVTVEYFIQGQPQYAHEEQAILRLAQLMQRAFAASDRFYLLAANIGTERLQGQVIGTNYGYPDAFDVEVFTGSDGLRVEGRKPGDAARTVNEARQIELPTVVIEPDSAGAFEITRRPAPGPSHP